MGYETFQNEVAALRAEWTQLGVREEHPTALQERNNLQMLGKTTRGDRENAVPPFLSSRAVRWVRRNGAGQMVLDSDEVNAGVEYEAALSLEQQYLWRSMRRSGI